MRIKPRPGMLIRRGEAHLGSATGISTARKSKRRGVFARAPVALVPMVAALITGAATQVFSGEPLPPPKNHPPNVEAKPKPSAALPASTLAAAEAGPMHLPLHERIDRLVDAKLTQELPGQSPAAPATNAEFFAARLARLGRHDPDGCGGPGLPRRSLAVQAPGAYRSLAGNPSLSPANATSFRRHADGAATRSVC